MVHNPFNDKVILITGGTGSFGQAFVRYLLQHGKPKTVRIFSRDELKQFYMQRELKDDRLRFFLGDVRERERIRRACDGCDIVIHAAALKQVPACEYNPFEAVETNIRGAMNLVDACIDREVPKVIALSTDKAVNPVNLYGATKLCSDKIFVFGNSYAGDHGTKFACVRYGNVIGSRGSVLPVFLMQRRSGVLDVTDFRMTRFWITLEQAVAFVARSCSQMVGGEIFVPQIPSMKIVDLARAIAPNARLREIGIRPGEKLHETLIMEEEARHTIARQGHFVILPEWFPTRVERPYTGRALPHDYVYRSDSNTQWMEPHQMQALAKEMEGKLKAQASLV